MDLLNFRFQTTNNKQITKSKSTIMNIVLHQKTSKWTNMNKKLFKYKIVRFNLFMNIQTMVKVILILKNAKILIITKIQKE